jgi:hypothetical protein
VLSLATPSSVSLLLGLAEGAWAEPAVQTGPGETASPGEQASPGEAAEAQTPTPSATPSAAASSSTPTPGQPSQTPTPSATGTLSPSGATAGTPAPDASETPAASPSPSATATSTTTPTPSSPAGTPTATATPPAGLTRETVLTTLRLTHPRLMLPRDEEERIRRLVVTDVTARSYRDALLRNGSRLLTQPPPERVLIGPRLLAVSRTVLERVTTLGLLHRIDGDPRWAARARTELMAAAAFSDWNPDHFLDVAELCHAFAIGYDWMYDAFTVDDRAQIRRALIEKGLQPAQQEYAKGAFWTKANHNWNIVCNGGIAMACLAIGDEEPGLAGTLLAQALSSLPRAIASYAPGGAWIEGPSYWQYATLYLVSTLGSLTSALGTDFGLGESRGLSATGRFRIYASGPTGLFFNFADATARTGDEPCLLWLARRYDDPALAVAARDGATLGASARDLLWYDSRGSGSDLAALPLDVQYEGAELAFFRSAWNDKDALYVGFKGGNNAANHAHLDLGTFVLDALGQRWAVDLGPDDYNLPGYFGAERWTYERLKTSGQNTLMLDGANQDPKAAAPLTAFRTGPDGGFTIADLTAGYAPGGATRVQRGISLQDGRTRVLIQDEVETSRPADLTWTMHTQATIEVTDSRALLTQGGATLEARILAPADATFAVEDLVISPPQQSAPGVRRLLVRLPGVTSARIAVLLTPRGRGAPTSVPGATGTPGATATAAAASIVDNTPLPDVVPLDRWALADALGWSGT